MRSVKINNFPESQIVQKETKVPISVVILTKNEETGIAACLDGVTEFDEVIVVDSSSTDRTCEIARSKGAQVINFSWNGEYPKKKQWSLDNIEYRNHWILQLDADEIPSVELIEELRNLGDVLAGQHVGAANIGLDYVFTGRILKHGHRVVKRALVRKGAVNFPEVGDLDAPGIGEVEGHYQPEVSGDTITLAGRILHNDRDPVHSWFDRHNRYSDWEAYLRHNPGLRKTVSGSRSKQGKVFDKVPFQPLVFFVYSYVLKQGFRDGKAGFDYAFALSSYYWQIGLKERELRSAHV